ncbi:hypothetical protein PA25_10370 [Pseudoalteromonas sp. A25]|uniref:SPOR domain-containing protein n=1 Tax=Pseudoalteromonas sp. A25 TaxID=116092 RepID=UPI0012612D89|nr:SPOR domain-containing protein [Pseudoalteromonas sp. A25]BBN81052.1 hypothetical protein PA25_10370 [Pseudoalteromonas sp. A25]
MFTFYRATKLIIVTFGTVSMLSGCANTKSAHEQTATITQSELATLRESAQQWQAAKGGVDRLLRIEKELGVLISQLDGLVKKQIQQESDQTRYVSSQKNDSRSVVASSIEQVNSQTAVKKPPQNVSKPVAVQPIVDKKVAKRMKYALQLGAVTQKSRLESLIPALQAKLPEPLKEQLSIEAAQVNNVTFYRLKAGGYAEKAKALDVCNNLKEQSINCIVSHFNSETIKTKL